MQTNTFGFGVSINATTAGPTVNTTAVHDQDVLLPPFTSLDALASSPFRLSSSQNVNETSLSPVHLSFRHLQWVKSRQHIIHMLLFQEA